MLLLILSGLFCIVLTYFLYRFLYKPHQYWKERCTFFEKPLPFFGSMAGMFFQKTAIVKVYLNIYNKYPNKRYIPYYQFLSPSLLICDPDIIKEIAVKEFDTFPQHNNFVEKDVDVLWSKTMFALPGGQEWRDIRHTLSPAFTGNKLKGMFGLITACAEQFLDYFQTRNGDNLTIEMKDAFIRVTNDIIATTAFGVSCNSMTNEGNEIFRMGKGASEGSKFRNFKFFVAAIDPLLVRWMGTRFIGEEFAKFFRNLIKETIDAREKNCIIRPDMIHLLMEARKGKLKHEEGGEDVSAGFAATHESTFVRENRGPKTELTDDIITSQALVFYLAGFDTTARAMCFTAYELAINPDVQQRLHVEVDEVLEQCEGKITYEALMGMKYLDMVVSESLRKWPPFAITDRKPIRNFTIKPKNPDERPLLIEPAVVCQFPILAIHRDPKFYPDPMRFDPERFSDENRHNIKPFTYLPFGAGPKNCIGSRFALLEVKTIIFYVLSKFELLPVESTPIPLVLGMNVNPDSDEGFWLGLKRR